MPTANRIEDTSPAALLRAAAARIGFRPDGSTAANRSRAGWLACGNLRLVVGEDGAELLAFDEGGGKWAGGAAIERGVLAWSAYFGSDMPPALVAKMLYQAVCA